MPLYFLYNLGTNYINLLLLNSYKVRYKVQAFSKYKYRRLLSIENCLHVEMDFYNHVY